jgi:arylsulfatase A-like enzyme
MATAAEITGATLPPDAAEDSVSILPALLGRSDAPTREATVHQSIAGDLAIRQGPWKAVFFANGKRELYNLADDLSEKHDRLAAHPEVMSQLTALFQRYIDNGRSTPGAMRKNEFALSLEAKSDGKKPKRKAKQVQVDDN